MSNLGVGKFNEGFGKGKAAAQPEAPAEPETPAAGAQPAVDGVQSDEPKEGDTLGTPDESPSTDSDELKTEDTPDNSPAEEEPGSDGEQDSAPA